MVKTYRLHFIPFHNAQEPGALVLGAGLSAGPQATVFWLSGLDQPATERRRERERGEEEEGVRERGSERWRPSFRAAERGSPAPCPAPCPALALWFHFAPVLFMLFATGG